MLGIDVERDQAFLGFVGADDMRNFMQIVIAIGLDAGPSQTDQVAIFHVVAHVDSGVKLVRFEGIAYQFSNARLGEDVDVAVYIRKGALGRQRVATGLSVEDIRRIGATSGDGPDQRIGHFDFQH